MQQTAVLRREEVYQQLRSDILSCKLLPGTPLFEGILADRFEVSKSPIRDALSRLHAERLVAVMPRKGYQVSPISVSDAADLFEMRGHLEQGCARITAERAGDAALATLDGLRTFKAKNVVRGFVEYNRGFHLQVVDLCPNRRMADAARIVVEQFDRLVVMSVTTYEGGQVDNLVDEHNAVIDALQGRDGRLAVRLLAQHLERGRKRVMGALANASIVP